MTVRRTHFVLMLVAAASFVTAAQAMDRGTFRPPDSHGYHYDHEWYADGDGDGVKETHFVLYKDDAGDSIFSATTNGHLWAWSLNTSGRDSDPHRNYVIRDSNCDGVFDEAYSLEEKFHVPDCVKNRKPEPRHRP